MPAPASGPAGRPGAAPPAPLEEQLLAQLADRYRPVGDGHGACAGRTAHVVQAQRADGRIAARFWLDRDTGLPLRREMWDAPGQPAAQQRARRRAGGAAAGAAAARRPRRLRRSSRTWLGLPAELPGGSVLFDVGRPVHDGVAVLHLAYSDGLSTVSVFSQPGSVGSAPRRGTTRVGSTAARSGCSPGAPERAVWAGGGRVFTLVSDAGRADLLAAVPALPHDAAPATGLGARLHRGLAGSGAGSTPLTAPGTRWCGAGRSGTVPA